MSDIEKEFFEGFGIEPKIQNDYCYWECKDPKKQFKPCKKKSCEHFKIGYKDYPLITSDIVLGLEKLLGSFCCGTIAFRSAYWYKLPIQHIWWPEDKKEAFIGNTRIEALLNLFIEYKENIDQNEVKALFKC